MSLVFEKASEFLESCSVLTLATIGSYGIPNLSTVNYIWTGQSLFFATKANTRKAKNMNINPIITIIVNEQNSISDFGKSVEIQGEVILSENPTDISVFIQNFINNPYNSPNISDTKCNLQVYELKPRIIRIVDNSINPANIEEIKINKKL